MQFKYSTKQNTETHNTRRFIDRNEHLSDDGSYVCCCYLGRKKMNFKFTTKNEEMLNELKKLNDRLKVRKEKFNKSAV
jgi:hypothetical protein